MSGRPSQPAHPATARDAGSRGRAPIAVALIGPAAFFVAFFVLVPAGFLLKQSFTTRAGDFTVAHYGRFFGDSFYLSATLDTLVAGLVVSAACLVLGFPIGYSLGRMPAAKRRWRIFIVILPLTLSVVILVFGWMIVLGRQGLLNMILVWLGIFDTPGRFLYTQSAVVILLTQEFLPFMILSIMSVVTQINPVLEQAAASLRANRIKTFTAVIIPLAMPGILAGLSIVFILTCTAFIIPRMVGGTRNTMLGSIVYEQVLVTRNWPFAAAVAFVLLTVTVLSGVLLDRLLKRAFNVDGGARARAV
ncbi:MAG: ABC transporter permease [Pseudorhodoplanes sp.]